ncbi:hypothetical protein PHYBLDRAFT_60288 [Phycomyces blakesleeanus NRRL 1555(-)]|uniref:Uncharacterized protein n=1 Tax=Phycomyces blakesleeanus (strain ATCC 8743b / DSM 1359 / FGSC 10004 / NBRC 33097 / NRRL 1555) TaxID=763407 RepID=A0A167LG96_PHYB8|nr:hypothetical protein PHYBLDRAFT_60288 [Phycomyces blakesleeanus NRRL 1555(-)]OAD70388.1 hypothetical protein PHYBLDRAFT_60288 [Phycomyces blakesleeanus NRRL 1555(-)]|eukprot:XP_018288428.1 hypothetical protein PHYBLDRAFT_60288 [Phycomyces blakesleeanus NRRL 1555(-)]
MLSSTSKVAVHAENQGCTSKNRVKLFEAVFLQFNSTVKVQISIKNLIYSPFLVFTYCQLCFFSLLAEKLGSIFTIEPNTEDSIVHKGLQSKSMFKVQSSKFKETFLSELHVVSTIKARNPGSTLQHGLKIHKLLGYVCINNDTYPVFSRPKSAINVLLYIIGNRYSKFYELLFTVYSSFLLFKTYNVKSQGSAINPSFRTYKPI